MNLINRKWKQPGFHTLIGLAKRYVGLRVWRAYGAHSLCRTRCGACIRRKIPSHKTPRQILSVTCKTCDAEYIGETKRAIRIREKEHRDAICLGQCAKSVVTEHVHSSVVPHEVDWSSLQVLDRAGRKMQRKIRRLSTSTR